MKNFWRPLLVLTAVWCAAAQAAPERIEVPSRHLDRGQRAFVPLLIDAPAKIDRVLIDLPAGSGKAYLVEKAGKPEYGHLANPVSRIRERLKAAGIALITVGAPSDQAEGFRSRWRDDPDHAKDIAAVVEAISARFAGKPIFLSGYAEAAASSLNFALRGDDAVAGYVLLGGFLGALRDEPVERIAKPVLMLHAVTHKCASAPLLEARELAARGRFRLVEAGYPAWEAKADCGPRSQNALAGLDAEYANAILRWMEDGAAPGAIGAAGTPPAYHEEVHFFSADTMNGQRRLEMTVYRPAGSGPFPLLVFNHGDMEPDSSYVRKKARYRDFRLARLFADMGLAVAFPTRPGAGRSEGTYQTNFARDDGDATYKGREHAKAVFSAVEYLRTQPFIDKDRIILAGQSAGGFAAMYAASTNPTWLIGAIDFAGGRNNLTRSGPAQFNRMMVEAFAEFGRTTRVPTLWVFAENDSRYPKETILASHRAFEEAGGKATLLLFPPLQNKDGHHVHTQPELWQEGVRSYLAQLGVLVRNAATVGTGTPSADAAQMLPGRQSLAVPEEVQAPNSERSTRSTSC